LREFIDSAQTLDIATGGTAVAATACAFLALWMVRSLVRRKYAMLAVKEDTELLEIPLQAASRTTLPFLLVVAAAAGIALLGLEGRAAAGLQKVFTIAFFWQAGLWLSTALVAGLGIGGIVEAQDAVRFDRAHFAKYGPYSLDFEVVYFVRSADFGRYMDVQQAINFRIHEAFEALGVEFAYPTQTLWLAGGAGASARPEGIAT